MTSCTVHHALTNHMPTLITATVSCRLDSPMRPCHRATDQRGNVPLEVHRAAHSAAFKRSGQALGIGSNEVPQADRLPGRVPRERVSYTERLADRMAGVKGVVLGGRNGGLVARQSGDPLWLGPNDREYALQLVEQRCDISDSVVV
jgi:hypothetical protein